MTDSSSSPSSSSSPLPRNRPYKWPAPFYRPFSSAWWCQQQLLRTYYTCANDPLDCVKYELTDTYAEKKKVFYHISQCMSKNTVESLKVSIDERNATLSNHTVLTTSTSTLFGPQHHIELPVVYMSTHVPGDRVYSPDLKLQTEQLALLEQNMTWKTRVLKYLTVDGGSRNS